MGTVVRTWGSSPRPPGSLMIIRDDGQVAGSVSGGCIEDDLIARVKRGELAQHLPQSTSYGVSADEAQRFGLPCGGTVQLVLEPLSAKSMLRELQAEVESHRRVRRPGRVLPWSNDPWDGWKSESAHRTRRRPATSHHRHCR